MTPLNSPLKHLIMTNFPDPKSNRSQKRINRGVSIDTPYLKSRKHQRAQRRADFTRTISGIVYNRGMIIDPPCGQKLQTFDHNTGGANRFYSC